MVINTVVKKKILKYSALRVLPDIAYFSKYDSQMNHYKTNKLWSIQVCTWRTLIFSLLNQTAMIYTQIH